MGACGLGRLHSTAKAGTYATHGNEPLLNMAYGGVYLVARIRKVGRLLEFPHTCTIEKSGKMENRTSAFCQRSLPVMHKLGVAFKTSIFEKCKYWM